VAMRAVWRCSAGGGDAGRHPAPSGSECRRKPSVEREQPARSALGGLGDRIERRFCHALGLFVGPFLFDRLTRLLRHGLSRGLVGHCRSLAIATASETVRPLELDTTPVQLGSTLRMTFGQRVSNRNLRDPSRQKCCLYRRLGCRDVEVGEEGLQVDGGGS
jgi:hypothetical protein